MAGEPEARASLRSAEAALGDVERLIELQPQVPLLYAFRATAKAIGGDTAGATADFEQALVMATDAEEISPIEELRREYGP